MTRKTRGTVQVLHRMDDEALVRALRDQKIEVDVPELLRACVCCEDPEQVVAMLPTRGLQRAANRRAARVFVEQFVQRHPELEQLRASYLLLLEGAEFDRPEAEACLRCWEQVLAGLEDGGSWLPVEFFAKEWLGELEQWGLAFSEVLREVGDQTGDWEQVLELHRRLLTALAPVIGEDDTAMLMDERPLMLVRAGRLEEGRALFEELREAARPREQSWVLWVEGLDPQGPEALQAALDEVDDGLARIEAAGMVAPDLLDLRQELVERLADEAGT